MEVVLVYNPSAGSDDVPGEKLTELITDAGHTVCFRSTKEAGWRSVLGEGADLYVAAGGDGTIRKVITELSGSGALVGIIPLGTANNLARSLGVVAGDPEATIAEWGSIDPDDVHWFDVPMVESGTRRRGFVESVGGGLFADLMARADRAEAAGDIDGDLVDALGLLSEVLDEEPPPRRWSIFLDGRDISGEYVGVEVMNIGDVGPRVGLSRWADPRDGLLDVVTIGEGDLEALACYVRSAGEDGPAAHQLPLLSVHRGRRLRMRAPSEVAVHIDDRSWAVGEDLTGGEEVTVTIDGSGVRVLASPDVGRPMP